MGITGERKNKVTNQIIIELDEMREDIIRVLFDKKIHFFSRPHDFITVIAVGKTE